MDKKETPLVSIITPVLNGERYIKVCTESVLKQTYKNIEHIFVDGGSTDHSLEIIEDYCKRYPSRIRYITGKDKGVGSAVNKGFKVAKGEIFGWIDTDDFYNPDAVQTAVEFFDINRSAMLVFGGCDIVDEFGKPFVGWPVHATHYREQDGEKRLTFTIKPYEIHESLNDWQYIVFCATFYRRQLISAIGGFNDLGNDLDFWIRVHKHFRMWPMPDKIFTNWRLHHGSISMKQASREAGIRDNRLKEDFFLVLRYGANIYAARPARYYPVFFKTVARKLNPVLGWSYPSIMKYMRITVRRMDILIAQLNDLPNVIRNFPISFINKIKQLPRKLGSLLLNLFIKLMVFLFQLPKRYLIRLRNVIKAFVEI